MDEEEKPNCYTCVHRSSVPGSAHSECNNHKADVFANYHGIRNGWFNWPFNFDPVWLVSCDGYSNNQEDKLPPADVDPLVRLMAMLR